MAVKTITIDMEAYEALSRLKEKNESFSRVIKRLTRSGEKTARNLLQHIPEIVLGEEALEHVEDLVRDRERDLVSFRPLDG